MICARPKGTVFGRGNCLHGHSEGLGFGRTSRRIRCDALSGLRHTHDDQCALPSIPTARSACQTRQNAGTHRRCELNAQQAGCQRRAPSRECRSSSPRTRRLFRRCLSQSRAELVLREHLRVPMPYFRPALHQLRQMELRLRGSPHLAQPPFLQCQQLLRSLQRLLHHAVL